LIDQIKSKILQKNPTTKKAEYVDWYTTGITRGNTATVNNRTYAGQHGGHYIWWWPVKNLLLARHFNGVYLDSYPFDPNQTKR